MENEGYEFPNFGTRSLLEDDYIPPHGAHRKLAGEDRLRDDVSEPNEGYDFFYHYGCKFFTCVCGLVSAGSIIYAAYLFKCGEDSRVPHVITEAVLCGVLAVGGSGHWCKSKAVDGRSSVCGVICH